jgi:hypothetical protein
MKKLKPLLANILAYIIILIGFISTYFYMKNDISFLTAIPAIIAVIVFHPAVKYWSNFSKELLNIKNEE